MQCSLQNLMRPDIVNVPMNWLLQFYAACCTKSHMTFDVVYVPINLSLRFYAMRFTKSSTTPDIVYVPINWSLRFYAARCTKSLTTFTHVVYDFEYISTLPLSHMLLTLLRLITKKNYKK